MSPWILFVVLGSTYALDRLADIQKMRDEAKEISAQQNRSGTDVANTTSGATEISALRNRSGTDVANTTSGATGLTKSEPRNLRLQSRKDRKAKRKITTRAKAARRAKARRAKRKKRREAKGLKEAEKSTLSDWQNRNQPRVANEPQPGSWFPDAHNNNEDGLTDAKERNLDDWYNQYNDLQKALANGPKHGNQFQEDQDAHNNKPDGSKDAGLRELYDWVKDQPKGRKKHGRNNRKETNPEKKAQSLAQWARNNN